MASIDSDIFFSDILSLLRVLDEENVKLPRFLCDGYSNMPPASGFETIAEHIVNLMLQIDTLRSEVQTFKSANRVNDNNSLLEVKEELRDIKILLRGRENIQNLPSAPLGGGSSKPNKANLSASVVKKDTKGISSQVKSSHTRKFVVSNDSKEDDCQNKIEPAVEDQDISAIRVSPFLLCEPGTSGRQVNRSDNWQLVQRKRKSGTIKGSKITIGGLTGVKDLKDLYIGRCSNTSDIDTVTDYIREEFGISVVSCVCISNSESSVKSFKVSVQSDECEKLLDGSLWPENIRVRKFFNKSFKHGTTSRGNRSQNLHL